MQIYRILNKITGKSYVGKSVNYKRRFKDHIKAAKNKSNRRLYDSMNHHGIENFELILLEDLGEVSREEANAREIFWIKEFCCVMPFGYNMTTGGDGGNTLEFWSDEDKRKLWDEQAKNRVGTTRSDETKDKLKEIASIREATISPEKKAARSAKISKTNKERGISPPEHTKWKKGCEGAFKDRTHSEETREVLRLAREGKTYEEIYGDERAAEMKTSRGLRWTGANNPRYVSLTTEKKQQVIDLLKTKKMKMYEVKDTLNVPKFREWLREIGIDNYQTFYNNTTIEQWVSFWEGVKV